MYFKVMLRNDYFVSCEKDEDVGMWMEDEIGSQKIQNERALDARAREKGDITFFTSASPQQIIKIEISFK